MYVSNNYELTALDIKALKTSDRVKFWYSKPGSDWDNAELSYIEPSKDQLADADNPWQTSTTLTRRIDVNCTIYAHGHYRYDGTIVADHCYWSQPTYYVTMRTWVNLLKPGDVIRLDWQAGDKNYGTLEWVTDTLELYILRDGVEKYAFALFTNVCRKDGWGRMCDVRYPTLALEESNA